MYTHYEHTVYIRRPLPELERGSLQPQIHHPADRILLCCRPQDPATKTEPHGCQKGAQEGQTGGVQQQIQKKCTNVFIYIHTYNTQKYATSVCIYIYIHIC